MEDRSLLSPFYDLSTVASTGNGFVGFGDLVSINNVGTIAFVGYRNDYDADGNFVPDDVRESGLWTARPGQSPVNVDPGYIDTNGRDFGRAVAINDEGVLTARDRLNGFFLRKWDSADPDLHTNIATTKSGPLTFGKYASIQTFSDINKLGDVAFVGQAGGFRTLELYQHGQPENTSIRLDTFPSGEVGGPTPRPQLTDDGRVLTRLTNNAITLFDAEGRQTIFASAKDGFTETGAAPGITADGKVVVFTGNRGRGAGIFLSYYSDGARHIVRVAGEGFDDWTGFDLNSAVRVTGSIADSDRGVTVAFEGTNSTVGHGIFTARVSFFGFSGGLYFSDFIQEVRVSGAAPVALVGGSVNGSAITEIEPYGMNDQGRGELAFWVKTGSQEAIVRALPQQVLFVDLVPGLYRLSGYTEANLGLLEEVGLQNGWDGTFVDALNNAGYTGNAFALGSQIRQHVQDLYAATGARVRVVSIPPVFVPRTATDEAGGILTVNGKPDGAPIRNGAFQTVQVGESFQSRGFVGLAAPVYTRAGGLDFYNQIVDDAAVVIANHIFNQEGFSKPIEELTDAELSRAVANVIAHESGHNFGLVHTRRDFDDDIMHEGTVPGEYDNPQEFSEEPTEVDPSLRVPGATEHPAARLVYSTGGAYENPGDPPSQAIVAINSELMLPQRYKLSGSLTSGSLSVASLLVGTISDVGLDLLPVFQDVGSGNLAALFAGAPFLAPNGGSVILIGSTDGTKADIIGIPAAQAGAQDSLSLSVIGIVSDERLLGGVGDAFNLYRLAASGAAELIGTFTVEGEPEAGIYVGDGQLSAGSVLGLGETTPNGGVLTKILSIRNTGAAQLILGNVGITGPGYSVSQPGQSTLAPGEETTITVTLSDTTAGIGITGTLSIPSNDSNTPFTLIVRGTVDDRPRILGVTRLDNGTGPIRVAIDLSGLLQPGPAGNPGNFTIAGVRGEIIPVATAAYSEAGLLSRIVLTSSVNGNTLASGDYRVRIDGTQVLTATGAPLAATRVNLLSHQIYESSDLVTIGADGEGGVAVLSGPDSTGFAAPKVIVQGDFNYDGIQDFIATSEYTGELIFHWGLEEGGYQTESMTIDRPHPALLAGPRSMMAADWNGDGFTDLIVFDRAHDFFLGGFSRLLVYLNDGQGEFTTAPDTPIPLDEDVGGPILGVGDFTGDGLPDIAIGGPAINGGGSVAIYGKDPFLGYSQVAVISTEHENWFPRSAISADLNGDGRLDLVVETEGFFGSRPRPVVYLSTPTGLVLAPDLDYQGKFGSVGVGDFTGDGILDIAIVNEVYSTSEEVFDGGVISLLEGNGSGQFTARPNIILGRRGLRLLAATGDVNQDGILDLVLLADPSEQEGFATTTELSFWTLFGDGFGEFDLSSPLVPLAAAGNVNFGNFILRDLTGDGYPDLSYGNLAPGPVGVFINDGAGRLTPSRVGPLTSTPTAFQTLFEAEPGIVIADLNRDGFPDQLRIVSDVGIFSLQAIDVLWGNADGEFNIVSSINVPSYEPSPNGQNLGDIGFLKVGDLNNDGWLDLIVGGDSGIGTALQIHLGVDGRNFVRAADFMVDAGADRGVLTGNLADLNGDGNLDFVAVVRGLTGFGVFFGNGTGKLTYNANAFQPVPGMTTQIPVIADFNGDNKLDVAVSSYIFGSEDASRVVIYYGIGNGKFNLGQTLIQELYGYEAQLYLHDINRDGFVDIIAPSENDDSVLQIYLGSAGGPFAAAPDLAIPVGHRVAQLVIGDLTGDGFDDIALTKHQGLISGFVSTVSIFAGDGTGHFAEAQLVETGGLLPMSLALVPIAGTIEAGSFVISQPVLSVPSGAIDVSVTTPYERPVAINPRPLLAGYTQESIALGVLLEPLHGTVTVQTNGTPGDLGDDTFAYTPATGYSGSDSFTYLAGDGRGGTATGSVMITVTPANQNPVLTLSPGTLNYINAGDELLISADAVLTDADSANFQTAKLIIQIEDGFDPDFDRLNVKTTGSGPGQISTGYDGERFTYVYYSGVLVGRYDGGIDQPMTLTFTTSAASPDIAQEVLRRVSYSNVDFDRTESSQRTVTVTVTDGDGGLTSRTSTILLDAPRSNVAPVITTTSGSPVYTPGMPPIVVDDVAAVSDADSPDFAGGALTVEFSSFSTSDDRLAIRTVGTGVGQINLSGTTVQYGSVAIGTYSGGFVDSSALVITFNNNATPAIAQVLLHQITFMRADLSPEPREIRFVLDDGAGGVSVPASRIVTIATISQPPQILLSTGTTEYADDQTPVLIDDQATVQDDDSFDFTGGSLTVDFLSGHSAADRLGIKNRGTGFDEINLVGTTVRSGVTPIGTFSGAFTNNSPLVIALNSNANSETVETLIRHIVFHVATPTPTTSDRIIRFVLDDGAGGVSQAANQTVVMSVSGSETPAVQLLGPTVTYRKLAAPVIIDGQVIVTGPSIGTGTVGGGNLTISINDVNSGKKKFDIFNLGSLNSIGVARGIQLVNGYLVAIYDLISNVTAQAVQNALRSVTFQTSKKGLKFPGRTVRVQLADSEGDASAVVTKTINVSKKK